MYPIHHRASALKLMSKIFSPSIYYWTRCRCAHYGTMVQDNFCQYLAFSFQPKGSLIKTYLVWCQNLVLRKASWSTKSRSKATYGKWFGAAEEQCRQILEKRQSQNKPWCNSNLWMCEGKCLLWNWPIAFKRAHSTPSLGIRAFIQIREEVRQVLAEQYLPKLRLNRLPSG